MYRFYVCSKQGTDCFSVMFQAKNEEKTLIGDANTAHCSKAEPKNRPPRRPLPGSAGRPKFNQLEMVITFSYRPSLVRINARNFELSW